MSHLLAINIGQQFEPAQKFNTVSSLVNLVVSNLFLLAGFILFLGVIVGGFGMMTSGGNPDNMHKSQQMMTYSLIGIILIFGSYFLVRVLLQIFGVASFL